MSEKLSKSLKSKPKVCRNLMDIFGHCDIVLEAASVQAALQVAETCLKKRKPLVMMSTGGFLLNRKRLTGLAKKYRTKIYLPSGALCGLDGLKAARQIGKIKSLRITSTKPPRGFEGAPGLTLSPKNVPFINPGRSFAFIMGMFGGRSTAFQRTSMWPRPRL